MGWLSKIRRTKAEQWFCGRVEDKKSGNFEAVEVIPNECYLSVFLESLYIGSVRKGLTRFYGTLTSLSSLPSARGGHIQSVVVTTPNGLKDADAKHLARVAIDGMRLFGPAPYRGGDLELEVGLFSVPTSDLLGPYLEVVEDIAGLAAVPFMAAASPFIDPAIKALRLLLGENDGNVELEIGLAKTWAAPEVGLFAVARRSSTGVLSYDSDRRLLTSDGQAIDEPHLVLRILISTRRDDWQQIPDLLDAYNDFKNAAIKQDLKQAQFAVEAFRLRTQFSPDLISSDASRLAAKCFEEYQRAFKSVQTSHGAQVKIREFSELDLYG